MKERVEKALAQSNFEAVKLLEILRAVQMELHYIPRAAMAMIAERLNIPIAQVQSVVEFYSFLHSQPQGRYEILISDSITDQMLGNAAVLSAFSEHLDVAVGSTRADGLASLNRTSCSGLCDQGPAALVNGQAIGKLDSAKVAAIADLIKQQKPLSEWPPEWFVVDDNLLRTDLLLKQPIQTGQGLQATFKRGLQETLEEVSQSGLRGRGGAGYTTAWKWHLCYEGPEENAFCDVDAQHTIQRYVICNADEGEPGTFKDRVLLNSYADQVFEGMTICAAIIGAKQGFLYLRGEYLHLRDKLQTILEQRRQAGLLGTNILQQGFDFDIEIRMGAGAYICGEESALIESLEGKAGIPRNRPPYPVTYGYLGKPTVVNNVETFLAAAAIATHGSAWFANIGTAKSKGTKILSICGDCARPGIYEYPFGMSIQAILEDCGAPDAMGVQVGGPSGTFISNQEFARQLAFEDLATGGSFIVFNHSRNILDMVQNFSHFFAHESCGFCTPCRVGTSLVKKQVDKIVDGYGSAGDVTELEALCRLIKTNSHCGLGQTAANPVLTTLERYPDIYQSLLKSISYEPGFDLDAALATARRMANRDDAAAHLLQIEEEEVL